MQPQPKAVSAGLPKKIPWHIFVFLLAVFWFTAPYDLSYSKNIGSRLETMDVGTAIGIIQKGNIGRRIGLLTLAGVSLIGLLYRGLNGLRPIGLMGYLLLFYLVWATLSIFWTADPLLTARRLVVFWLLVISVFYVADSLSGLIWSLGHLPWDCRLK